MRVLNLFVMFIVFLFSVSFVQAFPVIGSLDGLTFGTNFGAWWISEGNSFNLLLNDYSDWYTVYVNSVDANGCVVGIAEGANAGSVAVANVDYIPVGTVVSAISTQIGVYQVDLTPPTIRCRIAYNFDSLGPIPPGSEEGESAPPPSDSEDEEEAADDAEELDGNGMDIVSCEDPDNGKDPHVATSVVTHFANGGSAPHPDVCIDADTVREYYCIGRFEGQNYTYQDYNCPSGCVDGACVHQICAEMDGGDKKYVAGAITHDFADLSSPARDYCYANNDKLVEFFCDGTLHPPQNPEIHNRFSYTCAWGCVTENGMGRCRTMTDALSPAVVVSTLNTWASNLFSGSAQISEIPPSMNGYTWVLDQDEQDQLEYPIIRAWDQGSYDTDLKCPAGYLVSTIEVASERYLTVPHVYGITLYCVRAGGEDLLDLSDTTTRSWNIYSNDGGFTPYDDAILTGLKGYYYSGSIDFMKKFKARQTQYHYNDEVGYAVGGTEIWEDVPEALSITSTANSVAYCGSSNVVTQRDSVSGISGLRIYSITRNNKEIVSAVQLRCSTLNRMPDLFS